HGSQHKFHALTDEVICSRCRSLSGALGIDSNHADLASLVSDFHTTLGVHLGRYVVSSAFNGQPPLRGRTRKRARCTKLDLTSRGRRARQRKERICRREANEGSFQSISSGSY